MMIMACTRHSSLVLISCSRLPLEKNLNLHNNKSSRKKHQPKRRIKSLRNSAVANSLFGLCGFFTKFSYFSPFSSAEPCTAAELKSFHTKHQSQPPADTMVHGGFGGGVVLLAGMLEVGESRKRARREKWKCDFLLPSEQTSSGALNFPAIERG